MNGRYLATGVDPEAEAHRPIEIPQVGHGRCGLARRRRGWRDGDPTGDVTAEDLQECVRHDTKLQARSRYEFPPYRDTDESHEWFTRTAHFGRPADQRRYRAQPRGGHPSKLATPAPNQTA